MGPSFDKKTKFYIPSTINTQKKLLKIAIWVDQKWASFWQIKKYNNLIILKFQVHLKWIFTQKALEVIRRLVAQTIVPATQRPSDPAYYIEDCWIFYQCLEDLGLYNFVRGEDKGLLV